jgi:hypothetical protein
MDGCSGEFKACSQSFAKPGLLTASMPLAGASDFEEPIGWFPLTLLEGSLSQACPIR